MKTAKELELLLLVKEHEKQKLQLRIKNAIEFIDMYIKEYHYDLLKESHLSKIKSILEGENNEVRN